MSSVDERVVRMQFDNQQFESGVKTSLRSLGNLKQGLNLDESAKSLTNLNNVGRTFSLAGIANGVDSIKEKFSALGIIGVTALANITNSAINAGKQLLSSLTVDPIKDGLGEYETKMDAIQTILTNTSSKGTTLDNVNGALEELNKYSDLTIYNFAQMTDNIGKMTAAGLGLNDSVTVVKGMSNVAAGFGVDATRMAGATYQMSQALSAGSIKLMDWKSLEQSGMGGEMLQNSLRETAASMGVVVDAGTPFRETLQSGWLTTDIFVKTMDKMANDKLLTDAAQNVTSLTKLLGTMKESVGSGWAATWENIIGDKNQSTKLFTDLNNSFNSIIGPGVDARNAMLSFWNANGGRDMIIQAITNAFHGLEAVLIPIHDAFREIFPPMTGDKLVAISKGILDLTNNFKMSSTTIANIKSTFKGLFAILDIGKQAIFALGRTLIDLVKYISPVGGSFLSVTGSIGNFLVYLDELIKQSKFFETSFGEVGNAIKMIIDIVRIAINSITGFFKGFDSIDLSGIDSLTEHVRKSFEPLGRIGVFLESVMNKVSPIFYTIGDTLGKACVAIKDKIASAFNGRNGGSIFDLINGGLLVGLLLGVKKLIKSLTNISEGASGFLEGITNILDGVEGSLKSFQANLKANVLLKIAIAIGILAVSLMLLATIDPEKLTSSMAAMSAMFIELFGSMAVFEKIMGSEGFKSITKVTMAMIAISIAILILSDAMTKLSKLDWQGIGKGLLSIAVLCAIMVKTAKSLSESSKGLIRTSIGLVIFAEAINLLADAVIKLGVMDFDTLTKGLFGVATLCLIMVKSTNSLSRNAKGVIKSSIAIAIFAGAINLLVTAVQKLGLMDVGSLAKGLISVGILMTEISLFMKSTNLSGMSISKSVGILILAGALNIFAIALKQIAEINIGMLIKGLATIAIVLKEVSMFINSMGDSKKVISTAIAMNLLGTAMLIFAEAVGKMGSMPIQEIAKGLLAMSGVLAIISVALKTMPKNMIVQSIGLLGIATSLVILAEALTIMGGMSWSQLTVGLIALAGSLTIMAVAMHAMRSGLAGAAAMLVMAGALAILTPSLVMLSSLSLTQIGTGLLAMAGAFAVMGVAGLVIGPIVPAILALSVATALFGVACLAVGVGISAFATGLTALASVGTAAGAVIVTIITDIISLIPSALEAVGEGIIQFIEVIGANAPVIGNAVLNIMTTILNTIITMAPQIGTCIEVLLTTWLNLLVTMVPAMVDAGMKLILGILQGVADNIQGVVEAGINVILNFINGVSAKIPAIIDTAFKVIISFINGLADAIRNNHDAINAAVGNLISAICGAVGSFMGSIVGVGHNIINGFIQGMREMGQTLVNAATGVVSKAVDGIKNFLGIHSPSRVFAEIGKYSALGMAKGLTDYSSTVSDAAVDVGSSAVDSMGNISSKIANAINCDSSPTITPVLNLDNVMAGSKTIDSVFNKNRGLTMAKATNSSLTVNDSMQPITDRIQNGGYSSETIEQLKTLLTGVKGNNPSENNGTNTIDAILAKMDDLMNALDISIDGQSIMNYSSNKLAINAKRVR